MPRPPTFDAEDLATAGLAVVRRSGWEGVSVRAVAAAAGVSPMATYRLAADADALRRLVADAAAAAVMPVDAGDLFATLDAWARAAHDHLVRLPGLSTYVLATWTELPTWLDVVETLLARAARDGLVGPAAVEGVNAVCSYVFARAGLHRTATTADPRLLRPVRDDPGRYPHVAAQLLEFAVPRTGHHFVVGLEALLAGLRERTAGAAARPSSGSTPGRPPDRPTW